MEKIKFNPNELEIVDEIPGLLPDSPPRPVFNFPVSPKEAYVAAMKRKPIWQLTGLEAKLFTPKVCPDNVARGFVFETDELPREEFGGKDMFGIEWEYIDVAGGSMVKPGTPFLEDANDWPQKVVWPDIDSWDWEGSAKANEAFVNSGYFITPWIMNGFFERLISFMDFEGAAMALIDEDQIDAVKALFEKLTDLYITIIDKFIEHFPSIGGFCVHDDWGSQKAPFFSPDTSMEMIVPAMKRLTDYIHAKGLFADLHSCGHLERQVPSIIAAGWDTWNPQIMNDTQMLYEEYGDKIILGVIPDQFDPETTSEEEQRAAAVEYIDKFCQPGKPSTINMYGSAVLTPAYREELYKYSRIKYSSQ